MSAPAAPPPPAERAWSWPAAAYDRGPALTAAEWAALDWHCGARPRQVRGATTGELRRLLRPIEDVLTHVGAYPDLRYDVVRLLVVEMHRRRRAFWGWTAADWLEAIGPDAATFAARRGRGRGGTLHQARRLLAVLHYLLCPPADVGPLLASFKLYPFARHVFGRAAVDDVVGRLRAVLRGWGYREQLQEHFAACVCYLLLRNRSPRPADLALDLLEATARDCAVTSVRLKLYQVSQALAALGAIPRALPFGKGYTTPAVSGTDGSIAPEWLEWCRRWRRQSTLQRRDGCYYPLLKVGRWLRATHPGVTGPADWTYELAAEFVAAVGEMTVGQWSHAGYRPRLGAGRAGQPLHPVTQHRLLGALRTFLRDCQEWGWVPMRLNPHRALRTPHAIRVRIGPSPRVVDRDLWAKLLWAALHLEAGDLPRQNGEATPYPVELVRALAAVWCFSALRSDEIRRLRVGCVRWQHDDVAIPETGEVLPKDAVCLLDIPVNKTQTAYTKPVHPLVGRRIADWERVRPAEQPRALDRKTSDLVAYLFSYRGRRTSARYLNETLIPLLCRKAGVPEADSRGQITSHRARATIASMLYNAREPLTILELMAYLGHKHLSSTQHYLHVDPTRLAWRVANAGYLEQNLATVEVLLDQGAVTSGAAGRGEAWKYYDLGHGYCANPFWAACQHRMACARCAFYRPKESAAAQLLEGKANLARMLEFVTLTEEERGLVTEGVALHQALLDKLADVPTPAGPTPRELAGDMPGKKRLPVVPSGGDRRAGP